MALVLEEMGYETGLDMKKSNKIAEYFNPIRDRFRAEEMLNPTKSKGH